MRKPENQRSLTLLNCLTNKQETIGNPSEFVLEACVSNARQEAHVIHLYAGFGGGWLT